jgi:hypothetical protein
MHGWRWWLAALLLGGAMSIGAAEPASVPFDSQRRFVRADLPQAQTPEFEDRAWETVTLPHTAHTEALVTGQGARQWQGICGYRKTFDLPAETRDQEIILRFDGAMNATEVWVNGQSAGKFMGGICPTSWIFQSSPGPVKRMPSRSAWTIATTPSPAPSRWLTWISTSTAASTATRIWLSKTSYASPSLLPGHRYIRGRFGMRHGRGRQSW